MAFTKVAAAGINTGGSFVFKDINTTGIITASTVKVGSAVTIHTGGYLIGSSNLHSTGLTIHNINSSGVITATSFYGDGSNLTGIDATALKDSGGNTKVQANTSGAVVTGVLTATSFSGDGSNLTGINGFASALASSGPLNNIFKTSKTLEVTAGVHTVNSDASSDNLAFMRESIIHVAAGATFHIGSGTTLRTNVLGLF